jgi:hypothetical protein
LIKAFIPHVGLTPCTLEVEGRSEATDHTRARFKIVPMRANKPAHPPRLPVAAMPYVEGESWAVYQAKLRPALVLATGGAELPAEVARGLGWQAAPALLVAPYYGADPTERRRGWPAAFVQRISRGEYPQYAYDRLPLGGSLESILRFDHVQPVGLHHDSYQLTDFELSADALGIIYEWLVWLVSGRLEEGGMLDYLAGELAKLPE